MSESQAKAGPGFLLDYEDPDVPGTWVHVGEVQDIDGPSETTDTDEVTNQDSDEGFKEYVATLQDGGTVTFPMNLVPGDEGQQALADLKHDRLIVAWRIKMVDTGFYTHFRGLITALGRTFPTARAMKRNVTIKVTGPVHETESASGS